MTDQRGFFDLDERYAVLSKAGDPLERLSGLIDFEIFRAELDAALKRSDGLKGGVHLFRFLRPPLNLTLRRCLGCRTPLQALFSQLGRDVTLRVV